MNNFYSILFLSNSKLATLSKVFLADLILSGLTIYLESSISSWKNKYLSGFKVKFYFLTISNTIWNNLNDCLIIYCKLFYHQNGLQ